MPRPASIGEYLPYYLAFALRSARDQRYLYLVLSKFLLQCRVSILKNGVAIMD